MGRIGRPHGLRGEVTVLPIFAEHFTPGISFETESGRTLTVRAARPYRDRGLIVSFEGVSDRRAAEALRGETVTIAGDERRPLEAGEYWVDDLVALDAVSPSGEPVGRVSGVVFGPQDRLVIDVGDGAEIEVPFVRDLVGEPEAGTIVVDVPVGLERRAATGRPDDGHPDPEAP